jgi:hypothetical protein
MYNLASLDSFHCYQGKNDLTDLDELRGPLCRDLPFESGSSLATVYLTTDILGMVSETINVLCEM